MQGRDAEFDKMVAGHVAPAIAAIHETDAKCVRPAGVDAHWEIAVVRWPPPFRPSRSAASCVRSLTLRFRWCARRWTGRRQPERAVAPQPKIPSPGSSGAKSDRRHVVVGDAEVIPDATVSQGGCRRRDVSARSTSN